MSAVTLSWSRIFRGGRNGRHRAAAVFLGLVAGAVGGWNLTCAALLLAAVRLNTSLAWWAASFVLGLGWGAWGANLHQAVGLFFLDKLRLGAMLDGLTEHPLLAMFRLDEYLVCGGAATAALAALPAAHLAARFGGRKSPAVDAPTVDPWLRPWGVPATALAAVGVFLVLQTVGPRLTSDALLERLSIAAQVPVAADRIDYDLWSGELQIAGLRFGDAGDPARLGLEIDRVQARVEPKLLLGGRLHAEEMTLSGVRWNHDSAAGLTGPPSMVGPTRLLEGASATYVDDPTQAIEVQDCLRRRERWRSHLRALGRTVGAVECVADLESPRTEALRRLQTDDEFRFASHASAGRRGLPMVRVKRVRVVDLHDLTELSAHAQLELTNLTSRPDEAARHAHLVLGDDGEAFRLNLTFHLSEGVRRHEVSFALRRTAACDLVQLDPAAPVDLQHAVIETVRGQGYATRERFDVRTSIDVSGARVQPKVERLAGLAADLWRRGLALMPQWHFAVDFAGRWSEPTVRLLPAAMVADFKHQLRTAGAHELVQAIESKATTSAPADLTASDRASKSAAAEHQPTEVSAAPATPARDLKTETSQGVGLAASAGAATASLPTNGGMSTPAAGSRPVRQVAAVAAVDDARTATPSAAPAAPKTSPVAVAAVAGGPAIVPPIVELPSAPAERLATPRESSGAPTAAPSRLDALPSLPHRSLVSAAGRSAPPAFAGDDQAAPAAVAADPPRPSVGRTTASPAAPQRGVVRQRVAGGTAGTGFVTDETSQALQAEDQRTAAPYPATGAPPQHFGSPPQAEPRRSSTAGLRQPLGVAEPSAMPGALNLSTGYDQPSRRRGAPTTAAEGPSFGGPATPTPGAAASEGERSPAPILPPTTSAPRRYDRPRESLAAPSRPSASLPSAPPDEIEEPAPAPKPLLGALTTLFGKRPTGAGPKSSIANRHSVHVDEPTLEPAAPQRTGILPKFRTWFNRAPKPDPDDLGPVDPGPYINDGSDAAREDAAGFAVQSDYEAEESDRAATSPATPRATAARIPTAPDAERAADTPLREGRAPSVIERSTATVPNKLPPPRDLPAEAEPRAATTPSLSADRAWYDRLVR